MLQDLQPVRGFKCPISFDTTENPVYLKGCEHFFDRAVIENWFRAKFANADAAPCPMCNRPYSIVKFLPEGREQAIARLFERILIVPLVTREINRKLVKLNERKERLNRQNEQIQQVLAANRTQTIAIEAYNQQLVSSQQQLVAYQQQLERQNQTIERQNQLIEDKDLKINTLESDKKTLIESAKNFSETNVVLKRENDAFKLNQSIFNERLIRTNTQEEILKYNEQTSKLAMGIIGVACIPAAVVAPGVGIGMLAVTVIAFVATDKAKESYSISKNLTTKKHQ